MALTGSAATAKVLQQMMGAAGLNSSLSALTEAGGRAADPFDASQVRAQNAPAELAERNTAVKYPTVNVYCEKLVNSLTEKFRSFSGRAEMAVEIRYSQDRLEGLQDSLEVFADAAIETLNGSRGDWGDGMFYAGGYEVAFGPVKRGGKNFIQVAKVTFEIGVSRN